MNTEFNLDPADRFLRLTQVRELTGRSRSRIYDDPSFPRPIKLGARECAWIESEVRAWMNRRYQLARDSRGRVK
jgi:prophage regulatory protein